MTIPETIFFNNEGRPVARYFYSASEERVVAVKVMEENSGAAVDAASQWATTSLESVPVAVARYRTGARTLSADELAKMLAVVTHRFAGVDGTTRGGDGDGRLSPSRATRPEVAVPLVLQRYVAPEARPCYSRDIHVLLYCI